MKLRNTMLAALLALPLAAAGAASPTFDDYDYDWGRYYEDDAYDSLGFDDEYSLEVGDTQGGPFEFDANDYGDDWFSGEWDINDNDWWLTPGDGADRGRL